MGTRALVVFCDCLPPGMAARPAAAAVGTSGQSLVNGIARCRAARGDAEFTVNRAQVGVDRTRTNDQCGRHLGIGHAGGDLAQNIQLAVGKAIQRLCAILRRG